MPQKIIIVRHGETAYNKQSRVQGWLDIELSQKGIHQAQLLGKRLRSQKIHAIYTSDLKRALQTAKEIASFHQLTPKKTRLLRERNFGILAGKTWAEIEAQHPKLFKKFNDVTNLNSKGHKGETYRQFRDRVEKCLQQITRDHAEENVLISTHGGTKATILKLFKLVELTDRVHTDNTSVSIIEPDKKGKLVLTTFNDTSHLD